MHEDPQIPNYGKRGRGKRIKNGLTIAIEPMINMGTEKIIQLSDGWTIKTGDGKPSAHFEHDVAVVNGKPVILSTGMSNMKEVEDAINVLIKFGGKKLNITVLHCNTEYPTPIRDVNLNAMLTIRDAFKVNVGYSDHTLGNEVPIAAVALGATVIEKHFTLDINIPGP